ncbi:DUF5958 family protein [Streptomyces werraensis]|uniref:DUF5958 family protein n=1 Tax=Streptomyces werraensis TaxID=68284 RepID=UPI0037CF4576
MAVPAGHGKPCCSRAAVRVPSVRTREEAGAVRTPGDPERTRPGLRPTAEGVEWFERLSEDDRRKVLHALVLFCRQVCARQEDVPKSIAYSGIRPTHTPAVML